MSTKTIKQNQAALPIDRADELIRLLDTTNELEPRDILDAVCARLNAVQGLLSTLREATLGDLSGQTLHEAIQGVLFLSDECLALCDRAQDAIN